MKKTYPFKFLDSYTKEDTGIFFGRDEEIDSLYEMIFQTDMLLVYGASGTGKSSLIQCGLASKFQSHDCLPLYVRRGNNLNESLEKALKDAGGKNTFKSGKEAEWTNVDLEKIEDIESIKDLSAEESLKLWISVRQEEVFLIKQLTPLEILLRTTYLKHFRPIYLVFDQFEELFIIGGKEEQDQFISTAQEILKIDQHVKMIFSIREEYLGYLDRFEKAVPQLLRKKLRVEPMNFEKVCQVIWGATHLENTNVRLRSGEETDIMEGIFDRLKGGQKSLTIELPYLQVFLDKLYMNIAKDEERQAEAEFTLEELNKLGDIGDVLREFLEEQVKSVSQKLLVKDSDATEENLWKILSPFVTYEGTKEPISKKILKERLPAIDSGLIDKTIESFVNRRILRKSEKEDMYEIAHDSLARRIAEKRSAEENSLLEIVRIIKNQTFLKGEALEFFSEKKLNIIEPYLEKLREQNLIDDEGEDLIIQSRKRIEEEKEEEIAAQQRELELANKRAKEEEELRKAAVVSEIKAKKKSRYAAIAAIVAFIVAGAAFIFYYKAQRSEAEMRKQTEKAEKLIKSFYFWDDKLALASEINKFSNENKYGIIDKDGNAVVKFKYSSIEQFEYPGIARVIRDSSNYLVDTKGREYIVANTLSGLRTSVNALDLRGTAGGFSNEVFSKTQLKVLLLNGDIQNYGFGKLSSEIANLKNLSVLSLENCRLRRLPGEIDQLKSLHSLGLSNNSLEKLPPEIGDLESLQNLYLKHNELTQLPPEIGKLSSLQSLDLGYNKLKDLCPEIGQLTSLRKLVLDSNQLERLPDEIANLKSLKILRLFDNQLTQLPSEFKKLDSLQNLDLNGNQFTEFPVEVAQLRALQILNLSANKLKEFPDEIGRLGTLKELVWDKNQLVSLPSEIGKLGSLQILNMSGNKLAVLPKEIGKLNYLQNLYLSGNELNGIPEQIGNLNSLQTLDLSYNKLTQLPPEIGELHSLQSLMLWNNQLTQLPPEIGQLNSLQVLALNDNQLSRVPSEIAQLNSLIILRLYNNKIDSLTPGVGEMYSLKVLDLDSNILTSLPPEIGIMSSLQTLMLDQNQLTELPKEIGQLSSLVILDLKDNQLKVLPDEIEQLKSLRRLNLIGNNFSEAEQKRVKQHLPNCLILFSINDNEEKLRQELPDDIRQQLEDYEDYLRQLLEDFQLQQHEVKQRQPMIKQLQPEIKLLQPEIKQQQPEVIPHQPEVKPQQPDVQPQQPEDKQRKPEVKKWQPEVVPGQSEILPQQSEIIQQQSDVILQQPVVIPQQTDVIPQQTEIIPQQSEIIPQQTEVISQQTEVIPQQTEVIPQQTEVITQQSKVTTPEAQFRNYGIKGGLKYEQLIPLSEYNATYSFIGRVYFDFELSNTFSLELGAGYGKYNTEDSHNQYTGDHEANGNDVSTRILPVDARFKFTPWAATARNWNPYFYAGAGILNYSVNNAQDSVVNYQFSTNENGWAGVFPAGAGTELMLSNNLLLDFNIGLTYTTTDFLNNLEIKDYYDASLNIGLGITYGNFISR